MGVTSCIASLNVIMGSLNPIGNNVALIFKTDLAINRSYS